MPADAGQMEAQAAIQPLRRRHGIATLCTFLLGIAVGAGGLLVWQWSQRDDEIPSAVQDPFFSAATPTLARPIVLAPMPHAPCQHVPTVARQETVGRADVKDVPRVTDNVPVVTRKVVVPINQPDAVYTIPRPVDRGEHLVLRGQVRMLRVNGLESGAILDASKLEAGSIYVSGTIEGGSCLRIRCADGVVEVPASVSGRSRLEIDAPGSSVRFTHPTTSEKAGSRIDGGSTVVIIGRTVHLRGDVAGAGTVVRVALTRSGSLKVAAVRGTAVVEYRAVNQQSPDPPASAEVVEPGATFRIISGG